MTPTFVSRVAPWLAIGLVAVPPLAAQSDLEGSLRVDPPEAPPSLPTGVDLSTPVFEPVPPGGFEVPSTLRRRGEDLSTSGPAGGERLGPAPDLSVRSVRDSMTGPLFTTSNDGRIWARTRGMRAEFGQQGFVAYPVFGRRSPQEWPLRLDVLSATAGGQELDVGLTRAARRDGDSVTLQRGSFRDVYHLEVDSVEQTFVFDSLPTGGDLVVRVSAETELEPVVEGESLRFVHHEFGHVEYGGAVAIDAAGVRRPIERTWDGAAIVMTVPAAFLADATLPLTIDPVLWTAASSAGFADDREPDVTYVPNHGYFFVWQEYTSATNADVYGASFSTAGAQGSTYAVDVSNDHWRRPRVAYIAGGDRIMVVAAVTTNGFGTGAGRVMGRMIAPATGATIGVELHISSTGADKVDPDIGGNNRTSSFGTHALVIWSVYNSSAQRTIVARVVDWNGVAITGQQTLASQSGVRMIHPAVSDSHGDASLPGDFWTVAWIRDTNGDDRGEVYAREIAWNGNLALGTGTHSVEPSTNCSRPSVTSRFDDALPQTGQRPWIVAYERTFPVGIGTTEVQSDVFARVISGGITFSPNAISSVLEDFDGALHQFSPSIATDGRSFVLSYSERWWGSGPSGNDHDVYAVTGNIVSGFGDAVVALAERHVEVGSTVNTEYQARVVTQQDGDPQASTDRALVVWNSQFSANGGQIHAALVDPVTQFGTPRRAVGVQYCHANPNSVHAFGGRNRSWLWVEGSQSIADNHVVHCSSLPMDSFGYLIVGPSAVDVNMPAGSSGRLCVAGGAGRYVDQIANSGAVGTIHTTVVPTNMPSPTGPISASVGSTYHFQLWHRDSVNGTATSNFSNACRVYFAN